MSTSVSATVSAVSKISRVKSPRYYKGSKLVCVAKNYAAHKVEMGGTPERLPNPAIFLKPSSSVIAPGLPIVIPRAVLDLHHEVELGLVIGGKGDKPCKNIKAAEWEQYVSGYVLALDMTARDHQAQAKKDGMPWTLGKCWDTFAPLSSIIPKSSIRDPHDLELFLSVDGVERQKSNTSKMLHKIPDLLAFASSVMTLEKGDVLLTGTPEGVGPVVNGNVIKASLRKPGEKGKLLMEFEFKVVNEHIE